MIQKTEEISIPDDKDAKETTTAQTEEDLNPDAMFAFSQIIAAGGNV